MHGGSLVGRTFFVPQFCGPCKNGHEFGLMMDGDESSVKVEAVYIWTVFWRTDLRSVFDVTNRNHYGQLVVR